VQRGEDYIVQDARVNSHLWLIQKGDEGSKFYFDLRKRWPWTKGLVFTVLMALLLRILWIFALCLNPTFSLFSHFMI